VPLQEGLKENDQLPQPIITPTTKASVGHDEDISREELLGRGIVSEDDYLQLEAYTRALFARGTEIAAKQGLILVDTKYEFGKTDGKIYLIDTGFVEVFLQRGLCRTPGNRRAAKAAFEGVCSPVADRQWFSG
jgi:phosphoribosylaminoimidazole-succinocarboxamide synthase